jgi:small-conductance mechanosensitive channel
VDTLFVAITARLEAILPSAMGSSANHVAIGSITWVDVVTVLIYFTCAIILNGVVAWYVGRRSKGLASRPAQVNHQLFAALGKPLYILIWIYGTYLAATPILVKMTPANGLEDAQRFMNIVLDIGAFWMVFWFLFRATRALESRLALWASATPSKTDDLLVPMLGSTLRVMVIVVAIIVGLPMLGLPPQFAGLVSKLTSIVLIVSVAILLIRAVGIFQRVVFARFDITAADNLRARKVYTQLHVISQVIYVAIGIFAVSAILMLFDEVRQVGTSLLASAGVLGVIAGFAAQKTLANLLAGFQIALAQPVRQDDVVVVEGEWGRVEEITLTYIIVRTWDDRRLVLPLIYFIEKPFQNWTRTSADLMGSVFVWVDYSFPVDEARLALKTIIESNELWDGRFWNLQVSDAGEKAMQLRVLATAADSSKSWDLRCQIRERLITYIQRNHPKGLPRSRADIASSRYG